MDSAALHAHLFRGGHPPDGLVFDLDGTLWDSTETVARAWNRTLARMGQVRAPITPGEIAEVIGLPRPEICRLLFPEARGGGTEAAMLACYAEEEQAVHRDGGRLYEGVAEGLEALAERYPLFIVSNCPRGYIEAFLAWSGLGPLFRDFACHGGTGMDKQGNLTLIAGRHDLNAPVYVGDSLGDRQAAEAVGWPFVFARYGFGDAGEGSPEVERFADLAAALLPGPESAPVRGRMPSGR